jgi:RNA polymerase sigma-70 factor (ECF subfamily)
MECFTLEAEPLNDVGSRAGTAPQQGPLGLERAYAEYAPFLGRLALRLLGRADEVEDMVQDVFLTAAEKGWQLRDDAALKHWLASIAVNRARHRLRFRRFRRFLSLEAAPSELPATISPAASIESRALLTRVFAALDRVPVEFRVAWSLRYLEELEIDQCAALCKCSRATVKRRIAAAQSVLDGELRDA